MLINASKIRTHVLEAIDGELGRCKDFLFDDTTWAVRYMVASTHKWLPGRKILVAPWQLRQPNWRQHTLPVSLTRKQLKNAPTIDAAAPVSRREEARWADYFGYARYWMGPSAWGPVGASSPTLPLTFPEPRPPAEEQDEDAVHIRSCDEVIGYAVHTTNGPLGHVADILIDTDTWMLRYWSIEGRDLPNGTRVRVAPTITTDIDWGHRTLTLGSSREELVGSQLEEQTSSAPHV